MKKYNVIFYDVDVCNEYFSFFAKANDMDGAIKIACDKMRNIGIDPRDRLFDEILVILIKED